MRGDTGRIARSRLYAQATPTGARCGARAALPTRLHLGGGPTGALPVRSGPGPLLSADRPRGLSPAEVVGVWVVLVFVSVLFHELGHALAFRAFGYASTVQLVLLGGVTTPTTDRPLTWGKDVVTTLAGPAFGVTLGLLCIGLAPRATSPLAGYTLSIGAGTNLVWAAFNLLPGPCRWTGAA